ncbi:hypothetical protein [Desertihabitans aurantiacus]|uniref:hypothetical protein n=1 Tax=Desertihabitans aurantiacus TaxID=2282477 RepID=UPI000DF74927|nr:hypothetical protein [Desertihabitans aurantiacus]
MAQAAGSAGRDVRHGLDEEWAELGAQPSPAVIGWADGCGELTGASTPGDVLDRVGRAPDAVLGFLVGRAQHGGGDAQLAGRVVVQAMLGKLVRLADADAGAELGDYVAQLWCTIGGYPLARRPRSVAANLWMDTRKAVRREQGRPTAALAVPDAVLDELWTSSRPPADELSVHRVVRHARTLGLVDEPTAAVLLSVYADGLTSAAAGERHRMSTDVVRWRCSRARRRLAEHALALAAA